MIKTSACIAAIVLVSSVVLMSAAEARGGGGRGGGGGGGGRSIGGGGGGHSFSGGGGGGRAFSGGGGGRAFSAPRVMSAPRFAAPSRAYSGSSRSTQTVRQFTGSQQRFTGSSGNRNANVARGTITQNAVRNGLANQQWQGNRAATANVQSGQRFGLAGVAGNRSSRVIANQMLANHPGAGRAFARATFAGQFNNWALKHHRFHRFFPAFVIGWWGPLFWPYAYDDFLDYTFYPYAYDSFWPYAYDDLYAGMFGRYAYGYSSGTGNVRSGPGQPVVTTNLCSAEKSPGLTDWPIDQIAQTVEPNETQRAALEGLRTATAQALDILKAACPTDLPNTPTGRLEGMRQRIEVMLSAVRTVRPALDTFYHSLNDEQKARFNALGPDESAGQQQAQRDLAQMCSERGAGIASLPIDRIEAAVRPNDLQRVPLTELREAVTSAVNLLKSDCPTYRALTPAGRVEAMEQRLDAMMRAVQAVQPALDKFYAALSDEQKERFNRLAPAQQS